MPVKIHIFNAEILNEEKLLEVDFKGKKKQTKSTIQFLQMLS